LYIVDNEGKQYPILISRKIIRRILSKPPSPSPLIGKLQTASIIVACPN
jgi:hypothetical protein